jgi:hypothetical protein
MGLVPQEAMYEKTAWHHMGITVGRAFTIQDAIDQGLGFLLPVQKVPMRDLVLAYEAREDEYGALREDGKLLKSGHGEQWTPFQVLDGYDFSETIAKLGGFEAQPTLTSLGELDGGRRWFFTYSAGTFKIGDFTVHDHMTVGGSFDGSWALNLFTSPYVAECENLYQMAKAAGMVHYAFKHTSGIFDRVEQAIVAAKRHQANVQSFKLIGQKLVGQRVSDTQYKAVLDTLFPRGEDVPKRTLAVNETAREKVNTLYRAGGADLDIMGGMQGTAWGVVQAVNTYENWGTPIRKTKGASESTTRALRQIDANVKGSQPLTQKALALVS